MTGFGRDERGISIIEVMIAMLLLTAVVASVTMAFTTGSQLEQKRDVRSRMQLTVERVQEHLRSDKSWVRECRRARPADKPRTCDLSTGLDKELHTDDIWDVTFGLQVTATGVDNSGDGLAGEDTDGNADDFFQVRMNLEIPKGDRARLGAFPPLQTLTIVNGSTNSDSGALDLQFCGAANQVDERIQIGSCGQNPTYFEMPDCASPSGCLPRGLGELATPSITAASRFVAVQPLTVGGIRLRKVDGEDTGMQVDASAAVPKGPGRYLFSDLPSGTWAISYAMPGGWRDWETHHIPSSRQVTVEKQRTANALIALRRAGASVPYRMFFERVVRERWLRALEQTFPTPWIPECEQPASANRNAFLATTITCNTPHMTIVTTGASTNQSQMEGLNNDVWQYDSWGYFQERVTVKYIAEVNKAQYIWQGAAGAGRFSTQPEPAGRYTERTVAGNGSVDYVIPMAEKWTATVERAPYLPSPLANSSAPPHGQAQIRNIPLGLNAPVKNEIASKIGNVAVTYDPPNCNEKYLWVEPGGAIGSNTCRGFRMRGDDGECYTNLAGGWTGVNYTRRLGCDGIYWPPLNGTVRQPGYLVVQVCKQRISEVRDRVKQSLVGYSSGSGQTLEDFKAYAASIGASYSEDGSMSLGGKSVNGPFYYHRENLGTTRKVFNFPCEASPTVQNPMSCPQLDDWTNCSRAFVLSYPVTPGWSTNSSVEDGHRPANRGSSLRDLSG